MCADMKHMIQKLFSRNPFWSQVRSGKRDLLLIKRELIVVIPSGVRSGQARTLQLSSQSFSLQGRNPFWSQVRSGNKLANEEKRDLLLMS